MDQNDPVNVVANRRGDVLQKYTILKSDHFPGQILAENQYSMPLHSSSKPSFSTTVVNTCWTRAGCQNKKLLPLVEGAPNFRQVSTRGIDNDYGATYRPISWRGFHLTRMGRCQVFQSMEWRYPPFQDCSECCSS